MLAPELQMYLEEGGAFPTVRHPLVFSVPYFGEVEDERLNAMLVAKRAAVDAALADENWNRYVFMHERPYRFNALLDIKDMAPSDVYVELLREVWIDSENVWQNKAEWERELLPLAGTDPWGSLADKPQQLKVYRGGARSGLSWTLDKSKAKWFASRLGRKFPVWEAVIDKEHVIAYLDDRGEEEILLDPAHLRHCKRIKP